MARSMICNTMAEVINHTIQVQARGLLQPATNLTKEYIREQMRKDCQLLGVQDLDRDIPPVVHVAGTKGKGSTCAMVESILRRGNLRTGLFTSPHLVDIRERIRLNGKLLPANVFEQHVMDTYRLLGVERMETVGFFQFLTLTMFRLFALRKEEIDVLILETGIGGRLDYTNAVDSPLCCAITRLDFDHVALLGNTLKLIAGEKAGIAKPNTVLFTISNQPELPVIESYCSKVNAKLQVVDPLPRGKYDLGIKGGDHQLENAALAVAMARTVFSKLKTTTINVEETIASGLAICRFPGRAQVETSFDGKLTYYMDGAHTPFSVQCATRWFAETAPPSEMGKRALVFHCSTDRSAQQILEIIHNTPRTQFAYAFFVPPSSGPKSPAGYHEKLAQYWQSLDSTASQAQVCSPIELKPKLQSLVEAGKLQDVLVVGSFFLVGDALKYWVDDWNVEEAFM